MIPYGRQIIDESDIQGVIDALRSDWLTTGPAVEKFEGAVADYVGAKFAVAVSSGTAALHAAMFALGVGPGDEVIVPAMTFAATANCVVYQGGRPVFADVEPDTLLIDPADVEKKITGRTKAIIGVDYAGQPCDWDVLAQIAVKHDLALVDDGCHALGAAYKGRKVGVLADMTVFSFHPVKHITTGEGGMTVTNDETLAARMRIFRNHGITTDHRQREVQGSWFYEMVELGYNYRITDFQCALGVSQLSKLSNWITRRQQIAAEYDYAICNIIGVNALSVRKDIFHVYHLYVIRLNLDDESFHRSAAFKILRDSGIGVNVHYIPVHLHPFYRRRYGYGPGLCPVSESAYERLISLPMHAGLTDDDIDYVVRSLNKISR